MDRLEEWRIFVTVASQRSFAAAAKTLGRSPQAATRAVASLERRLKTRLLHRTTRSVSLTSDGERYLERGRRAIAELDLLESSAADHDTQDRHALEGTVTITAPVLFGQLHVVPIITKMLIKHPGLSIRLLLLDRIVSLAEEGVDVAVRIGTLPDSSLRARFVGYVRSLVCASPKYIEAQGKPRDPLALSKHSCIAWTGTTPLAERWSFRRTSDPAQRKDTSVTVHPRFTVNSGQAAIDAALAHVGIVRVLSYQVDHLIEQEKLVPILRAFEPEPVPVHLVQLPGIQARIVGVFSGELATALQSVLDETRAQKQRASII